MTQDEAIYCLQASEEVLKRIQKLSQVSILLSVSINPNHPEEERKRAFNEAQLMLQELGFSTNRDIQIQQAARAAF